MKPKNFFYISFILFFLSTIILKAQQGNTEKIKLSRIKKEDIIVSKIISLYNENKLRSAIILIDSAINRRPSSGILYYYLGLCFSKKEKFDLALNAFRKSLQLLPSKADTYYQIGKIFLNNGKNGEAIKYFRKCISYNLYHSLANFELGFLLFEDKKYDECRKSWDLAYNYPQMLDSLKKFNLSIILGNNEARFINKPFGMDVMGIEEIEDYPVAIKYRKYGANIYNNAIFDYLPFISQSILQKYLNNAEKYFKTAIENNPKEPEGYLKIGELYYYYYILTGNSTFIRLSQFQLKSGLENSKDYETSSSLDDYAKINYLLGLIAVLKEDFSNALKYLHNAEKCYIRPPFIFPIPPNWQNLISYYIGISYTELGLYDEAISYYERAIESHIFNLYPRIKIGLIFYLKGDYEKALEIWETYGSNGSDMEISFLNQKYNQYEYAYLLHLISKVYLDLHTKKNSIIPEKVIQYSKKSIEITNLKEKTFIDLLDNIKKFNATLEKRNSIKNKLSIIPLDSIQKAKTDINIVSSIPKRENGKLINKTDIFFDDPFFKQLLKWTLNRKDTLNFHSDNFKVNLLNNTQEEFLKSDKILYRLYFYCQYGVNATQDGFKYYQAMPEIFMDFLKKEGYKITLEKTYSMTGWARELYKADSNTNKFMFLFEQEEAGGSGYSKIKILENSSH